MLLICSADFSSTTVGSPVVDTHILFAPDAACPVTATYEMAPSLGATHLTIEFFIAVIVSGMPFTIAGARLGVSGVAAGRTISAAAAATSVSALSASIEKTEEN